ncbi:hypothetical protein AYX15_02706 [Cryptococcus neoformans]|nr:hypothetical protein AYX15_02706 [Cryptococcus neoformans var. grubii]
MKTQQREFLRQFEEAPQVANVAHVSRRAGKRTFAQKAALERISDSVFAVKGHPSIFDLFPGFDKVAHAVVEPMHALLEGTLPCYIGKVILGNFCLMPSVDWDVEEDGSCFGRCIFLLEMLRVLYLFLRLRTDPSFTSLGDLFLSVSSTPISRGPLLIRFLFPSPLLSSSSSPRLIAIALIIPSSPRLIVFRLLRSAKHFFLSVLYSSLRNYNTTSSLCENFEQLDTITPIAPTMSAEVQCMEEDEGPLPALGPNRYLSAEEVICQSFRSRALLVFLRSVSLSASAALSCSQISYVPSPISSRFPSRSEASALSSPASPFPSADCDASTATLNVPSPTHLLL